MPAEVQNIAIERSVARLGRLRNAPKDREAKRAAGEDLRRYCNSLEHIEATVEAIIEQFEYFPTALEIKGVASTTAPRNQQAVKRRESCHQCGGTGYVQRWYLVTVENDPSSCYRRTIREFLTDEQAADLEEKVGYKIGRQYVTQAADRCACMPPIPEEKPGGGYR